MEKSISIVKNIRKTILNDIADLSTEQLNLVPAGFNNNIIWNLGHLVAAQQSICYRRGGLPMHIDDDFWERYRPGSKPAEFLGADEFMRIKDMLFRTLDTLEQDLTDRIFDGYPAWVTRYKIEIRNIQDAITYLIFHEGLHAGIISAQMKLLIRAV